MVVAFKIVLANVQRALVEQLSLFQSSLAVMKGSHIVKTLHMRSEERKMTLLMCVFE